MKEGGRICTVFYLECMSRLRLTVLKSERKEEKFSIFGKLLCILHTQMKNLATKK